MSEDWVVEASCRGLDREIFFSEPLGFTKAMAVCVGCPVREQCLAYAMRMETQESCRAGIWGGTTPRMRRDIAQGKDVILTAECEWCHQPIIPVHAKKMFCSALCMHNGQSERARKAGYGITTGSDPMSHIPLISLARSAPEKTSPAYISTSPAQ